MAASTRVLLLLPSLLHVALAADNGSGKAFTWSKNSSAWSAALGEALGGVQLGDKPGIRSWNASSWDDLSAGKAVASWGSKSAGNSSGWDKVLPAVEKSEIATGNNYPAAPRQLENDFQAVGASVGQTGNGWGEKPAAGSDSTGFPVGGKAAGAWGDKAAGWGNKDLPAGGKAAGSWGDKAAARANKITAGDWEAKKAAWANKTSAGDWEAKKAAWGNKTAGSWGDKAAAWGNKTAESSWGDKAAGWGNKDLPAAGGMAPGSWGDKTIGAAESPAPQQTAPASIPSLRGQRAFLVQDKWAVPSQDGQNSPGPSQWQAPAPPSASSGASDSSSLIILLLLGALFCVVCVLPCCCMKEAYECLCGQGSWGQQGGYNGMEMAAAGLAGAAAGSYLDGGYGGYPGGACQGGGYGGYPGGGYGGAYGGW